MYALGPKSIGSRMDLQAIQFFVDFCNASIVQGNMHTSVLLPNFKALCMSMSIEVTENGVDSIKTLDLNQNERHYIDKLYSDARWFTLFTTRALLEGFIELANEETAEIIKSILNTVNPVYTGPLFVISTVRLGTPEESTIPKISDSETASEFDQV